MKKYVPFILTALCLASCGQDRVDTSKVKDEMDKYKIKKVYPGEILSTGEEIGVSLLSKVQNGLNVRLDTALKNGQFSDALSICELKNNQQIPILEREFEAKISRAGFTDKLRNQNNAPDSNQTMILEGYNYAIKNGLALKSDVFMEDTELVVNAPILVTKTCLPCHGVVKQDISEANYKVIMAKYPHDKATGFKLNEPIGVWTAILDKSFVIRNIGKGKK